MSVKLEVPENILLKPNITVFGIGGAGGNAVNNMIASQLEGVNFVAANTDSQALADSLAPRKIQLGETITRGLGAGALPEVGKAAAEEAIEQILEHLHESNMIFITAGMGGGTGTGAAPVIARNAKEQGILTIGVVTKPFHFEGAHRMKLAEKGVEELEQYVDTLIVIPNQNLFRIANESTTFAEAFMLADNVLHTGVRGITDLMIMPGLINLDFADIKTVMSEMGKAMMGTGEAEGEDRAIKAAEAAISNPLLAHSSMKGAKGVLINITGGKDMTLFEADSAANRIRDEIENEEANIIFGSTFNDKLENKMRVSVVATGIDQKNKVTFSSQALKPPKKIVLDEDDAMEESESQNSMQSSADESKETPDNFGLNLELDLQNEVPDTMVTEKDQTSIRSSLGNIFNRIAKKVKNSNKVTETVGSAQQDEPIEELEEDVYDIPAFIRRNKGD